MRARPAALMAFLLVFFVIPVSGAGAATIPIAQEADTEEEGAVGEEDETQQGEGGNTEEGEGQSDPDAETGAGQEEQEGGTSTEEEGPPWTYQMAWIGLALLVIIGLLMGRLYYRMIASRQRAA